MTSFRQPGTVLTDHMFAVPLDHSQPDGEQIEIFAREVVGAAQAGTDLPWLLFLQGGPGFGAQRPAGRETWLDRALTQYRVLLLDQRGTGRSSPANRRTLARLGSAQAQAGYLTHFRADSIVLDAELIRRQLTDEPWAVLGQSFGGFCAVSYLSFAPHGVREAFITGGLPGLAVTPDEVYRRTYRTVIGKNSAHYERYPGDAEQARLIAEYLCDHEVRLPDGAPLSVEAFQSAGAKIGVSITIQQVADPYVTALACKPTQSSCGWEMSDFGGYPYTGGIYYPIGTGYFDCNASKNHQSYCDPKEDQLDQQAELPGGSIMPWETYVAQQIPMLWIPNGDFQYLAADGNLKGIVPTSTRLSIFPQDWYYSS